MKTAATVLGIVGGAIALLIGLLYFINMGATETTYTYDSSFGGYRVIENSAEIPPALAAFFAAFAVSGVLGIAGGILVRKKRVLSGVFMLVACVPGLLGMLPFILLLIGGIFALIPEKQQPSYPYPPYPYPPYPPQQYPQYPQPPQDTPPDGNQE